MLVVDDDPQNCKLLEVMLRREGYLTRAVASGREALASIAQSPPDLILLDIKLPDMNGYQIAGELKGDPRTSNIPIIMVTVLIDRDARIAALKAGVEELVTKPIDPNELSLRVRNLLRLKAYGDLLQNQGTILEQQVQARTEELQRFSSAMDATADAIYLTDRASMRFIHVNQAACRMQGKTRERLLAQGPAELLSVPRAELEHAYDSIIASGVDAEPLELLRQRNDGAQAWVEVRRHALASADGWTIVTLVRDVTERKKAAAKFERMTRMNAILSGINGAIVHMRDRKRLYQEVCRIAVDTGGLPFAWLCVVDATGKRLEPVGYAGPDDGFLELIVDRLSLQDDAHDGCGISARSVLEKRVIRLGDVAVSPLIKHKKPYADRGIRSSAAFPLVIAGRAIGSFSLNASEVDFFDDEEMTLLKEVADNIAFALEHIEKEEKIHRLTRVYAVSSGIASLIVRVADSKELFREACRIAVEHGKFAMAWIGTYDHATLDVTPVAWAGEAAELLTRAKFSARDDSPRGAGAVGQSIRARRPVFINNMLAHGPGGPHLQEVIRLGFQSQITLPLYEKQAIVATLTMYSRERGYFDENEVRLLTELAADISFALENISRHHKLAYLAYYDELTGLANRSLFLERLAQHIRAAISGGHKLALFFLDLERFRNINDSLGRPAGDSLLKQVADWLVRNVGDASLLARLGSDQFAIVLPEVRPDGDIARLLDKQVQAFLDHPFRLIDTGIRIATKVGAALFPNDGTDAVTLLRNAEAALKTAKARGDRILFYTSAMNEAVAGNLTLENQLRHALENEEFVLHYQPKIDLGTGSPAGAEALIRWNDPGTGLVPPGRFIPILEETGLIYDVGRWAMHNAIAQYLRWRTAGLPVVRIAVNVSPLQLRSSTFIAEVRQAIDVDLHAAAGLELEITESVVMQDVKHSIATLQAIRAMGVTIAIDDFGTGFSSLSYLAKLPVDTLKIDRSFVTDLTKGPQGLTLVSTIINLARSLKLKVVAEGVETDEQRRLLRLLKCDEMQGFLLSKPLPAVDFEARFLALPAFTA